MTSRFSFAHATSRRQLPAALAMVAAVTAALAAGPVWAVDAFFQGDEPGGRFGFAVADAGDVNNDGQPDVIVGAPEDDTGGLMHGRAFIWFGPSPLRAAPDLILSVGIGGDQFGYSVAGIGDVNGDNIDDVAVGAPLEDTMGTDAGAVYVFFGGASMNTTADLVLRGEEGDDRFGWSVEKAGDMNGDGRDDMVVGAPFADPVGSGTDAGSVYLFLGASGTPSSSFARRWDGETADDLMGWDVADVPDFRGDGRPAVLTGAPMASLDGVDAGRAYMVFGGTGGTLPPASFDVTFRIPGAETPAASEFGFCVSQAGDFNNDNRTDVVIGGPGHLGDRGRVRVYYGDATPAALPDDDFDILGGTGGDRFGEAVSDLGDFDGVGGDDIAVGAPLRDAGGNEAGQVYLFAGGSSYSSASQGTAMPAENPSGSGVAGDHFGTSLSSAGDLDGDLLNDFVVGSPDGNVQSTAVSGVVGLVGSNAAIVPVLDVPMASRDLGDGWIELSFGGPARFAVAAEVWTTESRPRLLSALGQGMDRGEDALIARLTVADLAGLSELELIWSDGGPNQRQLYAVPAFTAPGLWLSAPSPNPFNPATTLELSLPQRSPYSVFVLDPRGRRVRTLAAGEGGPGVVALRFDGRDDRGRLLASGSYTVVLEAGGVARQVRALLLK